MMTEDNSFVLFEDGPKSKRLKVSLKEFKGIPLLDLRYWYQDKKTEEMRPTNKGIALTRANYLGMRSIAIDHHETVMDYLDVSSIKTVHRGDQITIDEQSSRKQEPIKNIIIEFSKIRPITRLYDIDHKGGDVIVTMNTSHPLIGNISDDERSVVGALLAKIFLSLEYTLMNINPEEMVAGNILLEQFNYDFSKFSKKLSGVNK